MKVQSVLQGWAGAQVVAGRYQASGLGLMSLLDRLDMHAAAAGVCPGALL